MIPSTLLPRVLESAILLALVGYSSTHPALLGSRPGDGEVLERAPEEIRLIFSEPVSGELSTIRLQGPSGSVTLGDPTRHPDSATVLIAPVVGSMPVGAYTVRWTVVGDDGHPVAGMLSFRLDTMVDARAEGVAGAEPGEVVPLRASDTLSSLLPGSASGPRQAEDRESPGQERLDVGSPLYAMVRWFTFGGIVAGLGALAFGLLILPRADPQSAAAGSTPLATLATKVGVAAGILILLTAALRLLAQRAAVFGTGATFHLEVGTAALLASTWGGGWALQLAGGAGALLGFQLARRRKRSGWGVALVGMVMVAASPALSGHAAAGSSPLPSILADTLHVLAAGGWIGGLLVLFLAVVSVRDEEPTSVGIADLVRAFSPLALIFAGVLVLTGSLGALSHLDRVSQLWGSTYGRVFLLKVFLFLLVVAAGAYNNVRMRPALSRGEGMGRFRLSAGAEISVATMILLVTSVLVATPTPTLATGPEASAVEEQVAETIGTFHRALEEGDSVTALALLAQDAFVLEGGGVESREEYLAHHLQADMAFTAGVARSSEVVEITVVGEVAWAVASTHAVGSVGDRSVDSRGAELVVLSREGGEWRIRAIHWSSRR